VIAEIEKSCWIVLRFIVGAPAKHAGRLMGRRCCNLIGTL
jgi:hypothetical protein